LIQSLRASALGGGVQRIARELHVSASAVYKMLEGEAKSPFEAVCQWCDAAQECKDRGEALAPLCYLVDKYLTDVDLATTRAFRLIRRAERFQELRDAH